METIGSILGPEVSRGYVLGLGLLNPGTGVFSLGFNETSCFLETWCRRSCLLPSKASEELAARG